MLDDEECWMMKNVERLRMLHDEECWMMTDAG